MSEPSLHSPPPAGWYVDANVGQERWWDGVQWTPHVRLIQPAAPSPQVYIRPETGILATFPGNPWTPRADLLNGKNRAAVTGFTFAIICLLVNPLALPSIGALVWSTVGLTRAVDGERNGFPPVGRTMSTWDSPSARWGHFSLS